MGSQINDELRSLRRQVADLQAEVARVPVRWPNGGGRPKAVIYARVNEAAGVADTDTTFDFDNATAIVGDAPSGGTGTAQNDLGNTYADNEKIRLWQGDDGEWYPDKTGGTASPIAYFELTADLPLSTTFATAKPVKDDGTLDTAATAIRLLDPEQRYVAKSGDRFFAIFLTADHSASGVAGWRIIDGEGPARIVKGTTAGTYSISGTNCTIDETLYDHADGASLPSSPATVMDPYDVATGTPSGTEWWLLHEASSDEYIFLLPIVLEFPLIVRGETTAVCRHDQTTFTLGTLTKLTKSGISVGSTIAVKNHYQWDMDSGTRVVAIREAASGDWYPLERESLQVIRGTASADVASTDTTFVVNSPTTLQGASLSGVPTLTVKNHFGFSIDSGGKVFVMRDQNDGDWYCFQAQCPE